MKRYFIVLANNLKYHFFTVKVVLLGSLFVSLCACSFFSNKKICKVGKHTLYYDELEERISLFYSHLDNNEAHQKAINDWIEQQQVLIAIQDSLPEISTINQFKAKDNLKQLNLFELENHYIQSNLDSTVTESEILKYYKEHRIDYKSNSFIVKALYIKIQDSSSEIPVIEKLYRLNNEKNAEKIISIANSVASNFYFEKNRWIYIDDLLRELSLTTKQKEDLVRKNKHLILSVDGYTHFINIIDFKTKSISSPMEIERDDIRQQILNRKINDLRSKTKENIINNVKKNYPVTYYE